MGRLDNLSMYLSFLLRHHPKSIGLDMDVRGWVDTNQLIENINKGEKYRIDFDTLNAIVVNDSKGRYRFNEDMSKIKACQGHSIEWVTPEVEYITPPDFLYHGTTTEALKMIMESGCISKMKRHAVHMQAEKEKAWKSAVRWKRILLF